MKVIRNSSEKGLKSPFKIINTVIDATWYIFRVCVNRKSKNKRKIKFVQPVVMTFSKYPMNSLHFMLKVMMGPRYFENAIDTGDKLFLSFFFLISY